MRVELTFLMGSSSGIRLPKSTDEDWGLVGRINQMTRGLNRAGCWAEMAGRGFELGFWLFMRLCLNSIAVGYMNTSRADSPRDDRDTLLSFMTPQCGAGGFSYEQF
jgi:hypothetical protein